MENSEILAKFMKVFPCYADQVQYVDRIPSIYGDTVDIHLKNGDTFRFIVWGECWKLIYWKPTKNNIPDYNESGMSSGLTD